MDIAQAKRRENIAEYILYLWQLEDLLRALQFSPASEQSTPCLTENAELSAFSIASNSCKICRRRNSVSEQAEVREVIGSKDLLLSA